MSNMMPDFCPIYNPTNESVNCFCDGKRIRIPGPGGILTTNKTREKLLKLFPQLTKTESVAGPARAKEYSEVDIAMVKSLRLADAREVATALMRGEEVDINKYVDN